MPDILSRAVDEEDVPDLMFGVHMVEFDQDPKFLQSKQRKDGVIREIIGKLLSGESLDVNSHQQGLGAYKSRWRDLTLNSAGILMCRNDNGLAVPVNARGCQAVRLSLSAVSVNKGE